MEYFKVQVKIVCGRGLPAKDAMGKAGLAGGMLIFSLLHFCNTKKDNQPAENEDCTSFLSRKE